MGQTRTSLEIEGLGKQKMAAAVERAKQLGMTPQQYLKHLVEEDLAVWERAKSTTFRELLGKGETVNEGELDSLVENSRNHFHRQDTAMNNLH